MIPKSLHLVVLVAGLQLVASEDIASGSGESGANAGSDDVVGGGEYITLTYRTISSAPAEIGATSIIVNDLTGIKTGDAMTIDPDGNAEKTKVTGVQTSRARRATPGTVEFADPLKFSYPRGFAVEFTLLRLVGDTDDIPPVDTNPHSDAASIATYAFADRTLVPDSCTKTGINAETCYTLHRGNGICTSACNTEACGFDDGDCKCSWNSDCPAGHTCHVGDCALDKEWESCAETRCHTDDQCDRARKFSADDWGSSSCGIGFKCEGSTCSYNCDAWCGDTFGEGWVSDGGSGATGVEECSGCKLEDANKHRTWIIAGCMLAGLVIVLIPGAIIFAVGHQYPGICSAPWGGAGSGHGRGVVSPAPEKLETGDAADAERRDTNPQLDANAGPPGVAETALSDKRQSYEAELQDYQTSTGAASRGSIVNVAGMQGPRPGATVASVGRPSLAARPAFVPSQQQQQPKQQYPAQQRQNTGQPMAAASYAQPTAAASFSAPGGGFAQPTPGGGFAQPVANPASRGSVVNLAGLQQPGNNGGGDDSSASSVEV